MQNHFTSKLLPFLHINRVLSSIMVAQFSGKLYDLNICSIILFEKGLFPIKKNNFNNFSRESVDVTYSGFRSKCMTDVSVLRDAAFISCKIYDQVKIKLSCDIS